MSSPSISVMKFGTELIFASHLRQSCELAQYCASFCIVASCTPCDASVTVSRSGHFVAFMRLRNSVSSASGTLKPKGRTAVGVVSLVWFSIPVLLCLGELQMCCHGEAP